MRIPRLFPLLASIALIGAGCAPSTQTPAPVVTPAGWKTFTSMDAAFAFDYPTTFGETVWHPRSWPPAVTIVPLADDPVEKGCPDLQVDSSQKTDVTLGGQPFTLLTSTDVGAGQRYDDHCYYAKRGDSYYVVNMVIWSHNGCGAGECGAYCGTQYEAECKALDREKDIQAPIDQIANTFRFLK